MPEITIYTTRWCGYCIRAKILLDSAGLPFVTKSLENLGEDDVR